MDQSVETKTYNIFFTLVTTVQARSEEEAREAFYNHGNSDEEFVEIISIEKIPV